MGNLEYRPVLGQGRGDPGPDFAVIRCVEWLQRKGEAVNLELWEGIWRIATTADKLRTRLRAYQLLVDRIDPVPKAVTQIASTGPLIVQWLTPESLPSPMRPALSSESSTTPSSGNGHAAPASSAIDDLANL